MGAVKRVLGEQSKHKAEVSSNQTSVRFYQPIEIPAGPEGKTTPASPACPEGRKSIMRVHPLEAPETVPAEAEKTLRFSHPVVSSVRVIERPATANSATSDANAVPVTTDTDEPSFNSFIAFNAGPAIQPPSREPAIKLRRTSTAPQSGEFTAPIKIRRTSTAPQSGELTATSTEQPLLPAVLTPGAPSPKLVSRSSWCVGAPSDPRIYAAYNSSLADPFDPFVDTPWASRNSATRPPTRGAAPIPRALPLASAAPPIIRPQTLLVPASKTPARFATNGRHTRHYTRIEGCDFSLRPETPPKEPSAPAYQKVPYCEPPAVAAASPASAASNPTPPSPTATFIGCRPLTPRRPHPAPRRTSKLRKPTAARPSRASPPPPRVPSPRRMEENGFPRFDARGGASFTVEPKYQARTKDAMEVKEERRRRVREAEEMEGTVRKVFGWGRK